MNKKKKIKSLARETLKYKWDLVDPTKGECQFCNDTSLRNIKKRTSAFNCDLCLVPNFLCNEKRKPTIPCLFKLYHRFRCSNSPALSFTRTLMRLALTELSFTGKISKRTEIDIKEIIKN